MQRPTFDEQYDELYPPAKPTPEPAPVDIGPVDTDLFGDPVPPAPKAKKSPKPTK